MTNRLKEFRGSQKQRQIIRQMGEKHLDVPLLSKLEKGICNPTLGQAQKLSEILGKDIFEIYDPADLDYSKISKLFKSDLKAVDESKRSKRDKSTGDTYKLTVTLPMDLQIALLAHKKRLGLKNQAELIEYCLKLLDKEKDRLPAGTDKRSRSKEINLLEV